LVRSQELLLPGGARINDLFSERTIEQALAA
jgi:hypothetical protein